MRANNFRFSLSKRRLLVGLCGLEAKRNMTNRNRNRYLLGPKGPRMEERKSRTRCMWTPNWALTPPRILGEGCEEEGKTEWGPTWDSSPPERRGEWRGRRRRQVAENVICLLELPPNWVPILLPKLEEGLRQRQSATSSTKFMALGIFGWITQS